MGFLADLRNRYLDVALGYSVLCVFAGRKHGG